MDEKGCIPLEWPSKRIPQGGIFHNHKVKYTPETQELMKVLMEESKLTLTQRKQVDWCLRSGSSLSEVKNEESRGRSAALAVNTIRPRTSRRRSYSAIIGSGDFERERYRPNQRKEDREIVKLRLQEIMEFGRNLDIKGYNNNSSVNNQKSQKKQLPGKKDIMHDLLTQIKERAEWLEDMEALGEGAKHRDAIHHQIAERFRKLEALKLSDEEISTVAPHFESNNVSAKAERFHKIEDKTQRKLRDNNISHSSSSNRIVEADADKSSESLRQETNGGNRAFDQKGYVSRISQKNLSVSPSPKSERNKYSRNSDKCLRAEQKTNDVHTRNSTPKKNNMENKSQKRVENIAEISLTCTSCLSTDRSERKSKKTVKS